MSLVSWWTDAPRRASKHVPAWAKVTLLLFMLIGIVSSLAGALAHLPMPIRLAFGLPLAAGLFWMGLGVFFLWADWVVRLSMRIGKKRNG